MPWDLVLDHMLAQVFSLCVVSSLSRAKIDEVTLDALRTRQSLVKGERLVRHEMRAVLPHLPQPVDRSDES